MAIVQWGTRYSVNVMEFDQAHQKLIALINELDDGMRLGKGKEVIGKTLAGLLSYTKTHFNREKECFAQYGYPEAASHLKLHDEFVAKVQDFNDKYAQNKIGLTIELMNYLMDWLIKHIETVDKRYGQFFNGKGLK